MSIGFEFGILLIGFAILLALLSINSWIRHTYTLGQEFLWRWKEIQEKRFGK